ncbi:MAG: thioesterase [Proteobacteria bacterium]|nr:MAG: thioesterase [Pseudomonadota bacterium]
MGTTLNFHIPFPAAEAKERLVVFHHAGGSALSFAKLAKGLGGGHYEVWLAELPGRGFRHREPALTSLKEYALACAREIPFDVPVNLYGHSMGAGLAFETARSAEAAGNRVRRVIVSCCRPPAAGHGPSILKELDPGAWNDEELLRAMALYGPVPPALQDPAGRTYFLPLFRHDLTLIRQYHCEGPPLHAPILAIAGRSDPEVRPAVMQGWRDYTEGTFQLLTEEGGHFCVLEKPAALQGLFERLKASGPC